MKFNGKTYNKNWLSFEELMKGAEIEFTMSEEPNKDRGIDESAYPYSFSRRNEAVLTDGDLIFI